MKQLRFKIVDVFTATPFNGNPVAVVLDAAGLTTKEMSQIANWINLSETTFVMPPVSPESTYRVRIFTPVSELPFAGHPTIGTAHALLESGFIQAKDGALIQECAAGPIHLTITEMEGPRWISFSLPQPTFETLIDTQLEQLRAILGAPWDDRVRPCLVDVGARWVVIQLPSAKAVLDVAPDLQRMAMHDRSERRTGVVIFGRHHQGESSKIEVRAFAPSQGVNEDPVCGSGNGCVAAYIRHTGQISEFGSSFIATQGRCVGRAGVLRMSFSGKDIRVAGNAVTCVEGVLSV